MSLSNQDPMKQSCRVKELRVRPYQLESSLNNWLANVFLFGRWRRYTVVYSYLANSVTWFSSRRVSFTAVRPCYRKVFDLIMHS